MTYPAQGTGDFTASTAITPADVLVSQTTAAVVGPLTSLEIGPIPMASPAYAIAIDALVSAAATIGILRVFMTWTDPASGLQLGSEEWNITGTSNSPPAASQLTIGRGPTKSGLLTVFIRNFDPVQSATVDAAIWQSSRIVTRDDWRGLAQGGGLVNWTAPNSEPAAGILGWENNLSLPNLSTTVWQCALYAGAAALAVELSAIANVLVQTVVPLPDRAGANWPNLGYGLAATEQFVQVLPLPRCPVLLQIINTSGAAVTVSWSLVIQEFAS